MFLSTARPNAVGGVFIADCMSHYQFRSWSLGIGALTSKQVLAEVWCTLVDSPSGFVLLLPRLIVLIKHRVSMVDHLSYINLFSIFHPVITQATL